MPDLTQALLAPFVAGFIVQRFLEEEASKADAANKKSGLTTQQLNLVNPRG
jgi:hypothetical protein